VNGPDLHVIGMGNILYRDEGIGVYAAHYLRQAYRFTPAVQIADGAAMGFGLMDYFQPSGPAPRLLILDALLADDQPGAIYRLSGDQLLDLGPAMRPTAHEVDPIQLLKLSTALGQPPEMVLLGIVPADTAAMAIGLTPQLRIAFSSFANEAIAVLRAWGVRAEPARDFSLDDVIGGLVTCQR
jgi:hydrogenase maturation protease